MQLNLIDEIREKHSDSNWIFISLGFLNRRAHVFKVKNNNYVVKYIKEEILKL